MKFCIATLTYWESIGFDTTDWRKSIDGTKAIAHDRFIKILIPSYLSDPSITTLMCPSVELDALLASPEWATPII